jgi:hypothetical protein
LERQKRLKASEPQAHQEVNAFGAVTDRKKKNEIYNQLDEVEKERFSRLDKVKIPEKRVKQIVTRVLGADVHINKTMLKVIGGIAKVWVGEIVEEAKLAQVREEHEIRQKLGLDKKDDIKVEQKDQPEDKDEDKESKDDPESEKEEEEVEAKIKIEQSETEDKDLVLMQTLHSDMPLMPYHLRMARDEYERKRKGSHMRIF